MYGSDWPVILLASSYQRWADLARALISGLSESEQACDYGRHCGAGLPPCDTLLM